MAYLLSTQNSACQAVELIDARYALSAPAGRMVVSETPGGKAGVSLWRDERQDRWALLVEPTRSVTVRLNGDPLWLGIAALAHRDEVRIGPARAYFSSETRARVESYVGDDAPRCPRCAQPVEKGQEAVRCPQCEVLHHQLAQSKECWTFSDTCAVCATSTDLAGDLRWFPGEV